MSILSRFLSVVLTPLLMPLYGVLAAILLTPLIDAPQSYHNSLLLIVVLLTCIVPILTVVLLKSFGVVSDYAISNRGERPIPYLVTIICFAATSFIIFLLASPLWLSAYFLAGAGAALTAFIINWVWKISAHLSGIGGLLGLLVNIYLMGVSQFDILPIIYIAILSVGLLATARLYLNRHTFAQVVFGFLNGFLWVYLF